MMSFGVCDVQLGLADPAETMENNYPTATAAQSLVYFP
jgi:hypothetical protein